MMNVSPTQRQEYKTLNQSEKEKITAEYELANECYEVALRALQKFDNLNGSNQTIFTWTETQRYSSLEPFYERTINEENQNNPVHIYSITSGILQERAMLLREINRYDDRTTELKLKLTRL